MNYFTRVVPQFFGWGAEDMEPKERCYRDLGLALVDLATEIVSRKKAPAEGEDVVAFLKRETEGVIREFNEGVNCH